jgi:hypothetical protein
MKWKPDWNRARENLTKWWRREGPALFLTAPRREPVADIPKPAEPSNPEARWIDPVYRCDRGEFEMSRTFYTAEAFPLLDTKIGPGSLGTFLGSEPQFTPETVWFEPCIDDPDACEPLTFDPAGRWFRVHMAVIEEGVRRADGRYLVGTPDLIENMDTLAALRGSEPVLMDLIERPVWVQQRLGEINDAYFASFDLIHENVRDDGGGNASASFSLWGPGRTAKVQCDFAAMISPTMFREFVIPYLAAQCEWLDHSMFHLDGEDAIPHLDALLEIDALDAIEWTPRFLSTRDPNEAGGSPKWYDLYRRIKAGGKSVQAVGVRPEQVLPLLDAVGPEGMFLMSHAPNQDAAETLAEQVEQYR